MALGEPAEYLLSQESLTPPGDRRGAVEQVGMDAPQAHPASIRPWARGGAEEETDMTTTSEPDLDEVMAELAALEDPRILAVNERHGDDHAVNLTTLRGVAKRIKKNQSFAEELWATGDSAARLLALLICRPKEFSGCQLDAMLREARTRKVHDWLVGYVVMKGPHAEQLRLEWLGDPDPVVAAAGWALTADRVVKKPDGLDLSGLLDAIEAEMAEAHERLQWEMNTCLAQIGIHHPDLRPRALEIGERLGVLRDYPTPAGCTSPYVPEWIGEMVRRNEG